MAGGRRNWNQSGQLKLRVLVLGRDVGNSEREGTIIKAPNRTLPPSRALAKHLPLMKPLLPHNLVRLVLTNPVFRNKRSEIQVDLPDGTLDAQFEF